MQEQLRLRAARLHGGLTALTVLTPTVGVLGTLAALSGPRRFSTLAQAGSAALLTAAYWHARPLIAAVARDRASDLPDLTRRADPWWRALAWLPAIILALTWIGLHLWSAPLAGTLARRPPFFGLVVLLALTQVVWWPAVGAVREWWHEASRALRDGEAPVPAPYVRTARNWLTVMQLQQVLATFSLYSAFSRNSPITVASLAAAGIAGLLTFAVIARLKAFLAAIPSEDVGRKTPAPSAVEG